MKKGVLIVGGGVSGLVAAEMLKNLGAEVTLIERKSTLGGILYDLRKQVPGDNCRFCTVAESAVSCLRVNAKRLEGIETLLETELTGVEKGRGGLSVAFKTKNGEGKKRNFDAVLLATGTLELRSEEELRDFRYGKEQDVLTGLDFEQLMIDVSNGRKELARADGARIRSVAFIACVGCRNIKRKYCSATCCSYAMRQFNALKRIVPDSVGKFFFMDIRMQEKMMWLYAKATFENGLVPVRCRVTKIERDDKGLFLRYETEDGKRESDYFDMFVLMTAQIPDKEALKLFSSAGVRFDDDGFVIIRSGNATHAKGIFACGCATGPKSISDSVTDSLSAVADIAEELGLKTSGSVAVLGSCVAGVSVADTLLKLGVKAELIEKKETFDNGLNNTLYAETKKQLDRLRKNLMVSDSVRLHFGTSIKSATRLEKGWRIIIEEKQKEEVFDVSAVVLALEGARYNPIESSNGACILSEAQFLKRVNGIKKIENAALILCDGAFSEKYPFCGRECCYNALRTAQEIKKKSPNARIYILMKEMASFGLDERFEFDARESGVIFLRYPHNRAVSVKTENGRVAVRYYDTVLHTDREISVDIGVFMTFLIPDDYSNVERIFGVETDELGFIKESEPKFRPNQTTAPRVFGCGSCVRPQSIERMITEAKASAVLAAVTVARDADNERKSLSSVSGRRCAVCGLCVEECPVDARFIDVCGKVIVDSTLCVGCGLCVSICPSGASFLLSEKVL